MVGGNFVVGCVIFLILVVIQFLVITKGAERVAEVAARFTLDAMPGKQMSIDADLNSGLIDEKEARARRRAIEREADFYGAMDGASKFVKGDAIAGIIIVLIDIIAGFIIGMMQRGMTATEAMSHYALLTVGDGLVSQIPALLVSTSTGIIVTRAAAELEMGRELTGQMARPKVLAMAAVISGILALMPGLPFLPFFVIAAVFGILAYNMNRAEALEMAKDQASKQEAELAATRKPENVLNLLQVDPVELEIGYGLIPLVDPEQGGDLLDRITLLRRQCALELGAVIPAIRIRDNMQLAPNSYQVKIKGVKRGEGELEPNRYLAMDAGSVTEKVPGKETREPAFGLPALWVDEEHREQAELAGYTVVDPPSVVATHLTELLKSRAWELLGRQEVQAMLDKVQENYPVVVEELVPNLLTVGEIQKVLANLLREGISIRNLVTILEALADEARENRDPDYLTAKVRQRLAPQITAQFQDQAGNIRALVVEPNTQSQLEAAANGELALEPEFLNSFYRSLEEELNRNLPAGEVVLLTSDQIRPHLARLVRRVTGRLPVLSYSELTEDANVFSVGMVTANAG